MFCIFMLFIIKATLFNMRNIKPFKETKSYEKMRKIREKKRIMEVEK